MTDDDPKPAISPEELQRRRGHVRTALAENRLEGITTTSPELQAVLDAYIRGEIEAADLVTAYLQSTARPLPAIWAERWPRRGPGSGTDFQPAYPLPLGIAAINILMVFRSQVTIKTRPYIGEAWAGVLLALDWLSLPR